MLKSPVGAPAAYQPPLKISGLDVVWSQPGTFTGVCLDSQKNVYAVNQDAQCIVFDSAGQKLHQFNFASAGGMSVIQAARSPAPNEVSLVIRDGNSLSAVTDKGKRLWQLERILVRDFCVADLTGDDLDETIVTYNNYQGGQAGVMALDQKGEPLWKTTLRSPGQVFVADLDGDGRVEVLAANARNLQVLNAQGKQLEMGNQMLFSDAGAGAARLPNQGADTLLVVSPKDMEVDGKTVQNQSLVALDGKGNALSTTGFPSGSSCSVLRGICRNRPWAVVQLETNPMNPPVKEAICVVDVSSGTIIASIDLTFHLRSNATLPQVAWIESDEEGSAAPVMLVVYGQQLTAFAVSPVTPAQPTRSQ